MRPSLRNVTLTLEDDVAQWARVYAAKQGTSVSQLLGQMLRERKRAEDAYDVAMRRALARRSFMKTDGHYPSRDELHARRLR